MANSHNFTAIRHNLLQPITTITVGNTSSEYIQNLYIKIQNLYRIYTILQKKILRKFIIKTKIYRKHI